MKCGLGSKKTNKYDYGAVKDIEWVIDLNREHWAYSTTGEKTLTIVHRKVKGSLHTRNNFRINAKNSEGGKFNN